MRYILKQKLFTIGNRFTIKDENENDKYVVQGELFTFGNKLRFMDVYGNELFFMKQRLFTWRPTYEIYRNGELFAVLEKELLTFFSSKFHIDVIGSEQIDIEGNFIAHDYTFSCSRGQIAWVSKAFFSFRDTYGIDINYEDEAFILACTVIIDMISHQNNK